MERLYRHFLPTPNHPPHASILPIQPLPLPAHMVGKQKLQQDPNKHITCCGGRWYNGRSLMIDQFWVLPHSSPELPGVIAWYTAWNVSNLQNTAERHTRMQPTQWTLSDDWVINWRSATTDRGLTHYTGLHNCQRFSPNWHQLFMVCPNKPSNSFSCQTSSLLGSLTVTTLETWSAKPSRCPARATHQNWLQFDI